jgi:hypothetical protein
MPMTIYVFALVSSMNYGILDFIGNIGVAVLVVTYLLLQLDQLKGNGLAYSLLNMIGATLILISLFVKFNLSAFVIEAFWVLISIVGIVKHLTVRSVQTS